MNNREKNMNNLYDETLLKVLRKNTQFCHNNTERNLRQKLKKKLN